MAKHRTRASAEAARRRARDIFMRKNGTKVVLEKTDRILGVPDVRVQVEAVPSIPAPAFTDGETITINSDWDPVSDALQDGFDPRSVMVTTGLNYHELAHCMFTPRVNSDLARNVKDAGMFLAFNALEDQLAESRFVSLYHPARHYFAALVSQFMLKEAAGTKITKEELLKYNYPIIAGRLFLPKGMRERFRNEYHDQSKVDEIDRLVAKYKGLIYPKDQNKMYTVIEDFHNLLSDKNPDTLWVPESHSQIKRGNPSSEKTQDAMDAGEFVDDEEEEGQDGQASGESDPEEVPSEGDGEDGDEEPDKGEQNTGEASGNAPGEVEDPELHETPWEKDLEEMLSEALNDQVESMEEELQDRIEAIQQEGSNYQIDADEEVRERQTVTPQYQRLVDQCVEEFDAVSVQHSPGWNYAQRSGKIDSRKYAKALRGDENVYKKWREGVHDALDFEVVFLLDQSGSMARTKIEHASVALWVLRRTFDECNSTTTVLGFSEEANLRLLSQRNSRASVTHIPKYGTIGATFVGAAIQEAVQILSVSKRKMKFCVVIGDGGFNDPNNVAMALTNNPDLLMAFVGINDSVDSWKQYSNVIEARTINNPMELVPVVQGIALGLTQDHIKEMTR